MVYRNLSAADAYYGNASPAKVEGLQHLYFGLLLELNDLRGAYNAYSLERKNMQYMRTER